VAADPDMYRCRKTELEWDRYAGNDAFGNLLGIVAEDDRQQDNELIAANAGYEIE